MEGTEKEGSERSEKNKHEYERRMRREREEEGGASAKESLEEEGGGSEEISFDEVKGGCVAGRGEGRGENQEGQSHLYRRPGTDRARVRAAAPRGRTAGAHPVEGPAHRVRPAQESRPRHQEVWQGHLHAEGARPEGGG